ncbi:hypothetical protein BD408DRAFT_99852 [Parasitella parasitica]|nr:hypothetical protein BD408DRAFT_99852 [Parasitella parasitica]
MKVGFSLETGGLSVCILTNAFKFKTEAISNLLKFIASVQACLKDVEIVVDQLCNEHGLVNASITLGVSNPYNAINLKDIVNPMIRHLSEKRDSAGLFVEDPNFLL